MDAAAKVTSKGQVTVPKAVRDALGIEEGDEVVFRVEGNRAVLARTPGFLDSRDRFAFLLRSAMSPGMMCFDARELIESRSDVERVHRYEHHRSSSHR